MTFSPDGSLALVAAEDVFGDSGATSLVLWDAETGQEIRRFEGHVTYVRSLAFSPDGRAVLAGSQSIPDSTVGDLILWDLETGEEIRRFDITHDVANIAMSADGSRALTGSVTDFVAILWDVATGRAIRRFEGHDGWVRTVAFSPDGRTAVSGGFVGDSVSAAVNPGELILWNLETGEEVRRFGGESGGHPSGVQAVAFSPDGRTVLASSGLFADVLMEFSLILWDVGTGEMVRSFEVEHDNFSVAISPDGRTALTGAQDWNVYLWDLATGERIQTFEGHQAPVTAVAFTPMVAGP